MKAKLHCDVTYQKMDTTQNRYSSFKVTVECDKVDNIQYMSHSSGLMGYLYVDSMRRAGPVHVETPSGVRSVWVSEAHGPAVMKS